MLKTSYQDADQAAQTDPRKEINSRTETIDEDELLERLKVHTDAVLVPNVALFKFYKLPTKLEGNLLLIMYLLNSTLDTIFEKLKPPQK